MSCNCDVQISNISNRINGLNSDISNIYSQSNSNFNLSNIIIQNNANINSGNLYSIYSNINASNVYLNGNISISSDYTFNNAFVKISNIYGNIVINSSTSTGVLNINGNANIQGNLNMGNYISTNKIESYKFNSDFISSYTNTSPFNYGVPQRNYIINSYWNTPYTSSSFSINSICWSPKLGLFCGVSENTIYTSFDGITWTQRTSPSTNNWISVCWSPLLNIFSALSNNGTNRAIISSDGITWTSYSITSVSWISHCWSQELGIFCAVASDGYTAISTNGTTWVSQVTPISSQSASTICWASELNIFCVLFQSGTGNRAMTSVDGINWIMRSTPADNNWSSIAWSPKLGLFCGVATSGTGNRIMTSINGINWTIRTVPENNNWQSITWASELNLFFSVASSGTNRFMYSINGINWQASYIPLQEWKSICWCPELGIFSVGNQLNSNLPFILSQSIYTYNPYVTYNTSNNLIVDGNKIFVNNSSKYVGIGNINPLTDLDIYGNIIVGNPLFNVQYTFNSYRDFNLVLYKNSGNLSQFLTSSKPFYFSGGATDKILATYNLNTSTNSSYILDGFAHFYKNFEYNNSNLSYNSNITIGSNTLIIDAVGGKVGIGNLSINTSNVLNIVGNANINGNLSIYPSFSNVNYANVLLTNGTFVSPYYNNSQAPVYGVPQRDYVLNSTVTYPTFPNTNTWYAICWSPQLGIFCAVAAFGTAGSRVMTSPDGITWTTRTSAADLQWVNIIWIPELFLFVAIANSGTGNRVMTSPNGITWTSRTSAADNNWYGITWSPELNLIVVVGASGVGNRVMTSPDGITWTSRTSAADISWVAVGWSPELRLFVAVAESGTGNRIMTSIDGINWIIRTSPADNNWRCVSWSPQLRIFCVSSWSVSTNNIMTSSDGINWILRTTPSQQLNNVIWCPEIRTFVALAFSGTNNRILTSFDGVTWTNRTTPVDKTWLWSAWSGELGIFVSIANDATTQCVMRSQSMYAYNPYFDSIYGNLAIDSNTLFVNAVSGNVGILTTTPRGNLEVVGNAAKTGGGNWSTSSDARVKENIQDANINRSYDIVKNLDLKYYQYDENTIPYQYDKHTLGWLAQDVETYFPKSILEANMYGYEDFKLLDYDLLLKSMYGALEKIINDIEKLEVIVNENEQIIQNYKNK